MHRTSKAAFAAALCSLAIPAAAGAATKTVTAGPPQKAPAGVPKDGLVNAFFPRSVAVHAGDSLKFTIAGFHAVNFVPAGEAAPSLAVPAPGLAVAGVKDATGQDFWFNGQPQLILNPTLVAGTPSGGAYDGAEAVYSGAPLMGEPKPWSVKLTKAGKYTYYCIIHPGMKGTVKVVAKGKGGVPSVKADAAHVKAQVAKAFKNLKKLDKRRPPKGDVIVAGPDLPSGETLGRFTPAEKTVQAGKPVTLTMADGTTETHSFTFARDFETLKAQAQGFIAPLPNSPAGQPPLVGLSALGTYPSDAPLPAYDGSSHGDGWFNTGVLDADPKSPLPQKQVVTFAKAGTYQYICIIHSEMRGKVTVK